MKNFLINFVLILEEIIFLILLVRILLSWFRNPYNAFTRVIYAVADPILNPFRKVIPPLGMIDISPIVAIFAVNLFFTIILRLLMTL